MYLETASANYNSSILPFTRECSDRLRSERGTPRMIRSVVEAAGLGRFVYLEGRSGKRYVFSSMRAEQVSLYDNAVFAATSVGGDDVRISEDFSELKEMGLVYYVHLPDADEDTVLADLNS